MPKINSAFVTAMSTVATVKVTSYENRVMTGWVYNAHYDKAVDVYKRQEITSSYFSPGITSSMR